MHERPGLSTCAIAFAAFLAAATGGLVGAAPKSASTASPLDRAELAARVRAELLHSWRGYERYAWGHDELKPVSKTGHDWYAASLLMTPVDSLDTLLLVGLSEEAERAKRLILTKLSFDRDLTVKNFEVTIRLLGGLLSAYQMTGEAGLLRLAEDLGTRLLPAFDSPTGMPYMYVNLKTGKTSGARTNPAEIGTLLLEFGTLSKLTGKAVFYDKPKKALVELAKRRSPIGLVGEEIDVETGRMAQPREPRRRRDRLLLRVPAQERAALRRRRLRADLGREPRCPRHLPGRRPADRALVRAGRHGHGQAHRNGVRRAPRLPPGGAEPRRRPGPRAPPARLLLSHVEPERRRARASGLPDHAHPLARISLAAGNHRVHVRSVSRHGRRAVPRDGPDLPRGSGAPLPHRRRASRS